MLTYEDAPWVDFLEINEDTWQRELRPDTPQEIRDKYEEYLKAKRENSNSEEMLPK